MTSQMSRPYGQVRHRLGRWVRRFAGWRPRLGMLWWRRDLRPAHQVDLLDAGTHHYRSTGIDPYFRLAHPVPAGWYLLRVRCGFENAHAEGRLYWRTGAQDSESCAAHVPLRSGRLVRRVVHFPERVMVRFDPLSAPGEFSIDAFQLIRINALQARKRIERKLLAMHPRYAPGRTGAASLRSAALADLWRDYNAVFDRRAGELLTYAEWLSLVEPVSLPEPDAQRREIATWPQLPLVSILVPTFETPEPLLRRSLDSVLAQSYPHWELCIADDASTQPQVAAVLREYAAREPRVQFVLRERNGHIAAASNSALELAGGEFVALLDHDDELAPHALYCVVRALQQHPQAALLYSDEDKLDAADRRCEPYFKPRFSPDLLYGQNYFCHLGVYQRVLLEQVGGFRPGFEGSQDYDLVLRCWAALQGHAERVVHVPHVLYHWRKTEGSTAAGHEHKDYASDAARRALQEHFDATCPGTRAELLAPGRYRARWPLPAPAPRVSLIIPTRDQAAVLRTCIESILMRTNYPDLELLVVDNQSCEPEALAYLDELARRPRVQVLRYDHPFNYSAINNFAARHASGALIGLVNNDVEVITPGWLDEMARLALRPDVGCVGAKLYYPDETIQHAGVVLGLGGVAGHVYKYFPRDEDGYFGRLQLVHNVAAVTAAVLLLRREVFEAVGGLDEVHLKVAFNDVDLCLKVLRAGYRNVMTPFAELYHHESKSRGSDEAPDKRERFRAECAVMQARWPELLADDPFYNPNLTDRRADYSLRAPALDASS